MSDVVIHTAALAKQFRVGARAVLPYGTLRDTIMNAARRMAGGMGAAENEQFWALRDVSFDVRQGEVVGLIGKNGAGKSTLLKILARITRPTSGAGWVQGRVGSLLEVGTGFHPELTGRENVYLSGAILGMKRADIERRFDEMIAFAEIDKFVDTPVKHYSSGMYLRLAFSVAAHLEPEILLVDEVLAVGDAAFQKKCLGKMGAVAGEGRTVFFVSHNMQAVSTLTQRTILLAGGTVAFDGPTPEAITKYLADSASHDAVYTVAASDAEPRITRVEVQTSEPAQTHKHGAPLTIAFEIATPRALTEAALSFQVLNNLQQPVTHVWLYDDDRPFLRQPGMHRAVCRIHDPRLYMGHYTLRVHLGEKQKKIETLDSICPFEVVMYGVTRQYPFAPNECVYLEQCEWNVK